MLGGCAVVGGFTLGRPQLDRLLSTCYCNNVFFVGERLGRCAIAEIQETVQFFPALSRSELVRTACRQLGWHAVDGATATPVGFRLRVLGALAGRAMVRLSAKRATPGAAEAVAV